MSITNGNNGNGYHSNGAGSSDDQGKLIVLTAPLTESIDHAGYFIQMAMASLPLRGSFARALLICAKV